MHSPCWSHLGEVPPKQVDTKQAEYRSNGINNVGYTRQESTVEHLYILTSPTMNLGYCFKVRRFFLSSLLIGGNPLFLQMASRELNTWWREPVFNGPQHVVNAADRMQLAITVSIAGSDWSFVCHDSCLTFKL